MICIAAAGYILTGSVRFLIFAGFLTLLLLIPHTKKQPPEAAANPLKKKIPRRIPVALAGMVILFLPSPLALRSKALWRYPFQRMYLNLYRRTVNEPAWFPDFRQDVVSDYSFEYLASVMQGTGHYSIRFMTAPERAAELEELFAAQAGYSIPLPENGSSVLSIPEENQNSFSANSDGWDGTADFYCDRDFWYSDGNPREDSTVYYLDVRGNWNHPASSVVIISRTGAVQYSQFGWTSLAYK